MKIFAVFADVFLIKKPDWLDNFRLKYDEPYDFHITLKQPCFIDETQVTEIKNKLGGLFSIFVLPSHEINLIFEELIFSDIEGRGKYIMLGARRNKDIYKLQNEVKSILAGYVNYEQPETKDYEDSFKPHITIARQLNGESLLRARAELKNDYVCEGIIKEVILSVVEKDTAEESNNPENRTVYRL